MEESDVIVLKQEIRNYICAMMKKITKKKSKYNIVLNLPCLNPDKIAQEREYCISQQCWIQTLFDERNFCDSGLSIVLPPPPPLNVLQMKYILNVFEKNSCIPEDDCEAILLGYQDFLQTTNFSDLTAFGELKDQLVDFFLWSYMC